MTTNSIKIVINKLTKHNNRIHKFNFIHIFQQRIYHTPHEICTYTSIYDRLNVFLIMAHLRTVINFSTHTTRFLANLKLYQQFMIRKKTVKSTAIELLISIGNKRIHSFKQQLSP